MCFDPFHVIRWANLALDAVYKTHGRSTGNGIGDRDWRRTRYALRAGAERLEPDHHTLLRRLRRDRYALVAGLGAQRTTPRPLPDHRTSRRPRLPHGLVSFRRTITTQAIHQPRPPDPPPLRRHHRRRRTRTVQQPPRRHQRQDPTHQQTRLRPPQRRPPHRHDPPLPRRNHHPTTHRKVRRGTYVRLMLPTSPPLDPPIPRCKSE